MLKIILAKGKALVYSPYNRDFVKRIRGIGGAKWTGKCWKVPADAVDLVRDMMVAVYGVSDLGGETVDVEIKFLKVYCSEPRENLIIAGKSIARSFGRDSNVVIDEDTRVVKGSITSGGSRANWLVCVDAGTVIRVKNVSQVKLAEVNDCGLEIKELERGPEGQMEMVDLELQRLQDAIKKLEEKKSDLMKEST